MFVHAAVDIGLAVVAEVARVAADRQDYHTDRKTFLCFVEKLINNNNKINKFFNNLVATPPVPYT